MFEFIFLHNVSVGIILTLIVALTGFLAYDKKKSENSTEKIELTDFFEEDATSIHTINKNEQKDNLVLNRLFKFKSK